MPQYKYQTAKGIRWMAKFNYRDKDTGEVKTEYHRGFESKREAKSFEEEFLDGLLTPSEDEVPEPDKTFIIVYNEYLSSHKREEIRESSIETKKNIFEKHIFPYFRDIPIVDITADSIAAWQAQKKCETKTDGEHYSDCFLRTIQSQFNSIINYAHSKGYIQVNPLADIKNMGVKDKRVEFWTTEEYEKFAYCAMNYPEFYYAYEILYWCGLREGEMLALTPRDINFNQATISITKTYQRINHHDLIGMPKTPSSVRSVSMPAFLCDELKEYMGLLYEPGLDERIFKFTKSNLVKNFHMLAEEAGLKQITIHGLRHSHVSLLISKKYDIFEVSKRIGHKSIKTTQDIYGHLFDKVQVAIANDLDNIRKGL